MTNFWNASHESQLSQPLKKRTLSRQKQTQPQQNARLGPQTLKNEIEQEKCIVHIRIKKNNNKNLFEFSLFFLDATTNLVPHELAFLGGSTDESAIFLHTTQ